MRWFCFSRICPFSVLVVAICSILLGIRMNTPNLCDTSTSSVHGFLYNRTNDRNTGKANGIKISDMKNGQLIHGIFAVCLLLA